MVISHNKLGINKGEIEMPFDQIGYIDSNVFGIVPSQHHHDDWMMVE